jgi:capsular exopolysaccharide synthesis family protein
MSKIFEAIQKGNGGAAEILPELLKDQPAPVKQASTAVADEPEISFTSPQMQGRAETRASIGRREARVLPLRVKSDAPVLIFDQPKNRASEQYRMLRTKIIQHPANPKTILISSPGPGDGKTTTAINLAGALALKVESKVLLIDTDFRRSRVHKDLGLPLGPGLTDVVAGKAALEGALIRSEQYCNLHVLTAGDIRNKPTELLDSAAWRELLGQLREEFEYIILDSPPIAAVADYNLLEAACDGVLTVVRPDHTKRRMVHATLSMLPRNKNLGVVMNCVDNWFLAHNRPMDYYYGESGEK